MQRNRRLSLNKQDILASIGAAIYVLLIVGVAQAWTYLSDTANAFATMH